MRALSAILFFAASASSSTSAGEVRSSPWNVPFGFSGSCTAASTIAIPDLPSNYYGIDMVPTKRVPGTGAGVGIGVVTFSKSPYGVSVTPDGVLLPSSVATPRLNASFSWPACVGARQISMSACTRRHP